VRRTRSTFSILVAVAFAAAAFASGVGGASAVPAPTPVDKVTICHRTNADNNPYVAITPDVAGVLDGHAAEHDDPRVWGPTLKSLHLKWGDIIPAFYYLDGHGDLQHFAGLNLDATDGQGGTLEGADILENDCVIPSDVKPPTDVIYGSLEVAKTVLGTPQGTPTPTEFTLHVSCDDGSVKEDVVLPLTGGTKTYDDLVSGITCTVTEVGTDTFADGTVVTFNGVKVDPSTGVDVEIPGNDTAQVTVDNDFSAVLGEVVDRPVDDPAVAQAVVAAPAFTG
jgi:hypothetical protein